MTTLPWHLRRMQVRPVWRATYGAGVKVAVLDSGVAKLPALGNVESWDHMGRRIAAADVSTYSHGTACASLIGSRHPKVPGIAPAVDLVSLRITSASGTPALSYVIAAFGVLARKKIPIASCSFTLDRYPPALATAVANYVRGGGIVVAATGKRGDDNSFPRMCTGAIVVGGVVPGDRPLSTANRGAWVDVCGPARQLLTFNRRGQPLQFGRTSGATALVAGACALVLSDAVRRGRLDAVTCALQRLLHQTADDVGPSGRDPVTGFGVVNTRKLLVKARTL